LTALEYLSERWKAAGISAGDTVLIHADTLRTLADLKKNGYVPDIEVVLDSFLDIVGIDGTLILPLFNFSFAQGAKFDIRSTPSQMGALTEAARKRDNSVRTGHPIYSFSALGKKKSLFLGINNKSGYAENSPFGILRELKGKIAVLDLEDQNSMTFYHHIEEMNGVHYRFLKEFLAPYVNVNGCERMAAYSIFVRKLDLGVTTHLNPTGELLWKNNLYHGERPFKGSGLRVIDADSMFNFVTDLIRQGRAEGFLYRLEKGSKE